MNSLELDRRTQREVDRATSYFRHKGILPVERFLAALDEVFERISDTPESGVPYRGVYRFKKMKKYRYVVFYQIVSASLIRVYAVSHASRKPGYWLHRTRNP